jgi:serine/threonine-protein kinase RsbW
MMDARCVIEVVDTGHGFDASTLSDTTGPLTAENGRGLQIIRALAQNLKIENQPQHGAIVRFEIPLEWVPGSPATFLATETGTSAR